MRIINERIWAILEKKKITLKALCKDLDLSYDTIKGNIRKGNIKEANFNKIVEYLHCNPNFLTDETEKCPEWSRDVFRDKAYMDAYPSFCKWLKTMIPEITPFSLCEFEIPEELASFADNSDYERYDFEKYAYSINAKRYPFEEYKSDFETIQYYFGDGLALESYLMNRCMDTIDHELHIFGLIKSDIFDMYQKGFSKKEIAEKYPELLGISVENSDQDSKRKEYSELQVSKSVKKTDQNNKQKLKSVLDKYYGALNKSSIEKTDQNDRQEVEEEESNA